LGIFLLLATPVQNTIVRTTESSADIFGLNAARQPDAFAAVALKLAEYRKLAPGKWEEFVLFDRPSGYNRILMAMRWKAEHLPESASPGKP
jgi:STE24 endopeptidase